MALHRVVKRRQESVITMGRRFSHVVKRDAVVPFLFCALIR